MSNAILTDPLSFTDALREEQTTNCGYDREKWLYLPCRDTDHRYILGTKGEHPLICIGVNPSTATPNKPDKTLQSVQRITTANGYDSFILCNLYPQRATSPDDLDGTQNQALCAENLQAIEWVLQQTGTRPVIWAAWGTLIEKRGYLADCAREIAAAARRCDAQWVVAGDRTKGKGHPHHPLYLPQETRLVPFADIESYIQNL